MLYIRGERGLGDSIYLYPIVKSYLDNVTEPIAVYSNYPKVFEDLKCVVLPFSKKRDDETQIFSYLPHKTNSETTIIEDITSSCAYDINFNKDHSIKNHNLVKKILEHKKNNKKICLIRYIEPRHNRKGIDNLDCDPTIINKFISEFKKEYYFVGIGTSNYHDIRCDMDLMGQTSVSDLFDLVFISDLVIAQVGYTVPLCELLHKNNIAIFPKKWQMANPFLKTTTPNKICGEYTSHVYDDQDFQNISDPTTIIQLAKNIEKNITLNVPQGVGDILWVYQKFYDHVDRINFNIIVTQHQYNENSKLRDRSVNFIKLLNKVNNINLLVKPSSYYHQVSNSTYDMKDILDKNQPSDYSCNHALEKGVRIEDIDEKYSVHHNIHINQDNNNSILKEKTDKSYIVLYVSGSTLNKDAQRKNSLWSIVQWCQFIDLFFDHHNLSKKEYDIVIIGANYDMLVVSKINEILRLRYSVLNFIDLNPFDLISIIKNSFYFIGYQSGLNVIADIYDVPQIMVYFPYLENMLYSWCKKDHIKSIFFATTFNNTPEKFYNNFTQHK